MKMKTFVMESNDKIKKIKTTYVKFNQQGFERKKKKKKKKEKLSPHTHTRFILPDFKKRSE